MPLTPCCIFQRGRAPILAVAIHEGHDTRPSLDPHFAIDAQHRRREEDPYTAEWTQIAKTQVVALRSRFEVDFNRPREKAVYLKPDDAWGWDVWKTAPDPPEIEASLAEYDYFYSTMKMLLDDLTKQYGRLVVYDLHTYNHRRGGADAPPADPDTNPEINVGTGTMDRRFWTPVVNHFIHDLRAFDFHGRGLDVRENIKFRGGHFCRWIHEKYPQRICALAIEVKKFFMDEWSGTTDADEIECLFHALQSTLPGVQAELERL